MNKHQSEKENADKIAFDKNKNSNDYEMATLGNNNTKSSFSNQPEKKF